MGNKVCYSLRGKEGEKRWNGGSEIMSCARKGPHEAKESRVRFGR